MWNDHLQELFYVVKKITKQKLSLNFFFEETFEKINIISHFASCDAKFIFKRKNLFVKSKLKLLAGEAHLLLSVLVILFFL